MKRIAAIVAAAALAGAAYAQDTTTAPTPAPAIEVPPSACPEVPAAPPAPDGATVTAAQMREAVASYEAWRAAAIAPMQCRLQEARTLQAQARARAAEYEAADAANQAAGAAWQAQVEIAEARRRR